MRLQQAIKGNTTQHHSPACQTPEMETDAVTYLGSSVHLEDVPHPPAPPSPRITPKHVMAGLVGEQDWPGSHGGVTQQHSFLLGSQGAQESSLGVLLQQDLLVTLHSPHHHLC